MINSKNIKILTLEDFQARKELVQDVVDRLLSNPDYKDELMSLNNKYPALKDYNRNLSNSKKYESN